MGNVYGHINGKPMFSRDEFIYNSRKRGALKTDEELIEFAKKVTSNWYSSGWHHDFVNFYLSDYALSEPYRSLTHKEFARLKELQELARKEHERTEAAREWKKIDTVYYADNSVEEIWEDKNGIRKYITTTAPHGDMCY